MNQGTTRDLKLTKKLSMICTLHRVYLYMDNERVFTGEPGGRETYEAYKDLKTFDESIMIEADCSLSNLTFEQAKQLAQELNK